jgi:hypothetical protein
MIYKVTIDDNDPEAEKVIGLLNQLSEEYDCFSLSGQQELPDEVIAMLQERLRDKEENPDDFMYFEDYKTNVLDKML